MLAAAPLLVGFVRRIKARLLGRVGPSLLQPWRDLVAAGAQAAGAGRERVGLLFRAAPWSRLRRRSPRRRCSCRHSRSAWLRRRLADLIADRRAADARRAARWHSPAWISAPPSAASGASREMTFAVFAEPALLLVIFTLALLAGTTNLDAIADLAARGHVRPARLARSGRSSPRHGRARGKRPHSGRQPGDASRS